MDFRENYTTKEKLNMAEIKDFISTKVFDDIQNIKIKETTKASHLSFLPMVLTIESKINKEKPISDTDKARLITQLSSMCASGHFPTQEQAQAIYDGYCVMMVG